MILLVIVSNTLILCLQDQMQIKTEHNIELVFVIIFTFEMVIKIFATGFILDPGSYMRDRWNAFDFVIIISSLIPYITEMSLHINLIGLRALRVLHPLRTIHSVRSIKIILNAFLASIPLLIDTFIILVFVYLLFAVSGLQLFSGVLKNRCFEAATGIPHADDMLCGGQVICPENYVCGKMLKNPHQGITNFDNMLYSLLQVFQITTLEGWSDIQLMLIQSFSFQSVLYFYIIIFFGNFFVMNIILAVVKLKFGQVHQYYAKLDRNASLQSRKKKKKKTKRRKTNGLKDQFKEDEDESEPFL